jgi:hypothetical protein
VSDQNKGYDGWAILELMGHVRLAGRVTEESHFGVALGRIDIPNGDTFTTQYFGGSSIYRLSPVSEQVARIVASQNQPEPVHRWELPLAARAVALPGRASEEFPYASDDDERGYQQADDEEDDREDEDEEEESRDFVAERHTRLANKPPDDPDWEH